MALASFAEAGPINRCMCGEFIRRLCEGRVIVEGGLLSGDCKTTTLYECGHAWAKAKSLQYCDDCTEVLVGADFCV